MSSLVIGISNRNGPPEIKFIDLVRKGHLPKVWRYVPMAGKVTYIAG